MVDRLATSWPSISMEPEVGVSNESRCRINVLLPEPEPPMITMISPGFTWKSTPFRIIRSP